tara:strand:+ start:3111 stop:3737 length:627 start_codon:yes stop_codon:yes gene_type:complete
MPVRAYFVESGLSTEPSIAEGNNQKFFHHAFQTSLAICLFAFGLTGLLLFLLSNFDVRVLAIIVYFIYTLALSVPVFRGFPLVGEDGVIYNTLPSKRAENALKIISNIFILASVGSFIWAIVDTRLYSSVAYTFTFTTQIWASIFYFVVSFLVNYNAVPPEDKYKLHKGFATLFVLPLILLGFLLYIIFSPDSKISIRKPKLSSSSSL